MKSGAQCLLGQAREWHPEQVEGDSRPVWSSLDGGPPYVLLGIKNQQSRDETPSMESHQ